MKFFKATTPEGTLGGVARCGTGWSGKSDGLARPRRVSRRGGLGVEGQRGRVGLVRSVDGERQGVSSGEERGGQGSR